MCGTTHIWVARRQRVDCGAHVSGECAGFVSVCWYNRNSEMALISAGNKEILQTWYQLDVLAEPPCCRLQPAAGHITRYTVGGKNIYFHLK
jgi:hypothetical protein